MDDRVAANVSVIIPTLNAGAELGVLLERLDAQSLKPAEILVIDSASDDNTLEIAKRHGATTHSIKRKDFNHGLTRHLAFTMTSGEYTCFFTQDAVPADESTLANLVAPMEEDKNIALVSGRQLPKKDARRMEQLVRAFNYSDKPTVRGAADVPQYGIKTFFSSDVCAAYRRTSYLEVGGFTAVVTSEDMLMAARLIAKGYKVAYEPTACVFHSHNLSPKQQYERNRLIGAFLAAHKSELMGANEIGEGGRLVKSVAGQLLKEGRIGEFFAFGIDCAARLAGNRAGKRSVARNEQKTQNTMESVRDEQ